VRRGMAIMVCFDLADIFLPLAKALRYLRLEPLDDIAFAVFAVVWIPTRCSPFDSSLSS
jgi:acyl-CoA-dependent ceramide synthase